MITLASYGHRKEALARFSNNQAFDLCSRIRIISGFL